MAEALAIVGSPLVQKLIKHADDFCLKKYNEVYGVKGDTEKLRSNLSSIKAVLKDAESCTKKSERLKDWLKKFRDASLDAEDALETCAAEAALREINPPSLVGRWLSRWNGAGKIKQIVERIISICDERSRLDFQLENCSTEGTGDLSGMNYRENLPYRCSSEVIGRKEEKEKIVEWLLSALGESCTTCERIPVVTITGMPGVGKTTLAQLVYNDERVFKLNDEDRRFNKAELARLFADLKKKVFKKKYEEPRFKKAAWVYVSADFNVDKILKDIVTMLTEVVDPGGPRPSILKLIANVLGGNPLLLVLDDVWVNDKLAWQELQGCLKTFPKGTKVLATSRDQTIATLLGAVESYDLLMLTEEHCWHLFCKEVFYNGETVLSQEKQEIGKEIIKKCQFLPLAVKVMGAILRGREIQRWKIILKADIWEAAELHDQEGLSIIRPILILSFDDLSPILKECFAYTSLFPKGHMFDKHELVKLWIAQGFIQHSAWTLEQLGGDYFGKLRSRSFFQFLKIHRKERFQMHDLMHDLAKHVSVNSQGVKYMNDSIDTTCRHVSFLCKDIDESTVDKLLPAQKLRTLLLLPVSSSRDFGHALKKMFKTLRYMRVLDLSSSRITELPESITELKLLHYLDLSRNEIRLLPTGICKLLSLQILKLVGCTHLQGLPNHFGNLKDLRHLELDDMFWKCSKLPPRLGGLTNLRNLHHFRVYQESGYGIEELKSMNSIEGSLHISNLENTINAKNARLRDKKGIHKLILEWSKGEMTITRDERMSKEVLDDLRPHKDLQELQIEQYKGRCLPSWFANFRKLYTISLNHCVNCRYLPLSPLHGLEVLHIKGMLKLTDWPEHNPFPSLSRLTISHCPQLVHFPPKRFLRVQVVKIKGCNALRALPFMPNLMFLTLVNNESLRIWSEVSMEIAFSHLLELEMVNCPRLMALPQRFAPEKLKIRECHTLNALPTQQNSRRLQYLEVDSCDNPRLIETVQMSPSLEELAISNIPFLPKLPNFPSLRSLYIHNCRELQPSFLDGDELGLLSSFTSLKFLSITECTIFPDNGLPTSIECLVIKKCSNLQSMHGRNNSYLTILSTLKNLFLEDCPNLESLPEDGLPNSLQLLCIRGCPLLIVHCREGGRYWDMISNVAHLELH